MKLESLELCPQIIPREILLRSYKLRGVLYILQRGGDLLSLSPIVISHQRVASREDPSAGTDATDQSFRV